MAVKTNKRVPVVKKSVPKKAQLKPVNVTEVVAFTYKNTLYSEKITHNLILDELTPAEVKEQLNLIPGRYAYWASMLVDVKREVYVLQIDYDMWYYDVYMLVDAKEPKKTEGWKKSQAILNNEIVYRSRMDDLQDLKDVAAKLEVLIKAYDIQQWTLRSIAQYQLGELNKISATGSGSLNAF